MTARTRFGSQSHAGPNLTPLVDVLFVLLVFLMLTAGPAATEHAVALGRLVGGSPRPPEPAGPRLDIYVDPPAVGATGVFHARLAGQDATDPDALADRLADLRRAFATDGAAPATVHVLIHPAPGVRWGPMADAFNAARTAGFPSVSIVRLADARRP